MTIKVGINGFGRIGRLALRAAFDWPEFEFVRYPAESCRFVILDIHFLVLPFMFWSMCTE